jgi:polyhydroxybutyrate depolymerase
MQYSWLAFALLGLGQAETLGAGDHKRTITVDELTRTHWIHVPPRYDPKQPAAVVLMLHGAMMDAKLMEAFCGFNKTADKINFVVVYPNGTGPGGILQTWNAGIFPGELNKNQADDVKYLGKVLDDVEGALNVNKKRIYAAGLSNGGMMTYRLAAELPNRIAAIASVAGAMVVEKYEPKRPVPVLHFHGTKDTLVPYEGPAKKKDAPAYLRFRSVEETVLACVKANGCDEKATTSELDVKEEKIKVVRKEYAKGKQNAEVVLYTLENGGHTWPGMWAPPFLGLTTRNFSASEVIGEFFQKHEAK